MRAERQDVRMGARTRLSAPRLRKPRPAHRQGLWRWSGSGTRAKRYGTLPRGLPRGPRRRGPHPAAHGRSVCRGHRSQFVSCFAAMGRRRSELTPDFPTGGEGSAPIGRQGRGAAHRTDSRSVHGTGLFATPPLAAATRKRVLQKGPGSHREEGDHGRRSHRLGADAGPPPPAGHAASRLPPLLRGPEGRARPDLPLRHADLLV